MKLQAEVNAYGDKEWNFHHDGVHYSIAKENNKLSMYKCVDGSDRFEGPYRVLDSWLKDVDVELLEDE